MNYESSVFSEAKNNIEYFILQGNSFEYQLNKSNYIALHYALKNNFIIRSALYQQDISILEGSLFLAKSANDYILKNIELYSSSVVNIFIDNHYFNTDYITNLNIGDNLKTFLANPNVDFAVVKCNYPVNKSNKLINDADLTLLNEGCISQKQLKNIVKKILTRIDNSYEINPLSCTPSIEDILEYIRTNSTTVNLKILSQKFNYSISHISELIHEETGLTFSQTLKCIRMAKSLELLKTTDKTVNEISESVGYNTTPGFIVAFQEMYNMTPTEYRRNIANLN